MGITIGAYQGNSSLEKWTNAHYKIEQTLNKKEEEIHYAPEEEDDAVIIKEEL
jgi:hypothetical protein